MKPHPYLLAPALALACLAGLVLAVAATREARGHAGYDWVMEGGYVDPQSMLCCDNRDCERAPAGLQIEVGRAGVVVNGVLLPWGRGAYTSPDASVHWCRHMVPPRAGQARCVFVVPKPDS